MPERLPAFPGRFKLSPEFRLLVACSWIAPPSLSEMQSNAIAALCSEKIDWESFLILTNRHGVVAQALSALQRFAAERIPEMVMKALKQKRLSIAARAMLQESELSRLNRLFTCANISMMPLKGVLLSMRLYGDTKMRSSVDLDLLVKPADLSAADSVLKSSGFRRIFPTVELSPRQMEFLSTGFHHFNYQHESNGLHLELHWRGCLWTSEQTALLWKHSELNVLPGQIYTCLNRAAELLYLCDHGAGHKWFRLKWLSDIAMLLSGEWTEGWEELVAMAEGCGLRRILAQSALLVWWLYGIPLPRELNKLIGEEEGAAGFAGAALELLLMTESEIAMLGRRFESLRNAWYLMRLKPSMPYQLILKGILVCPADMEMVHFPNALSWLYIPLRPAFWVWRHFGNKFGLLTI